MDLAWKIPAAPEKGLNVLFIDNLRPSPDGGMYEVADRGENAYLRIRIARKSKKFYMSARWKKGATSATSRLLGEFSASESEGFLTLAQARDKAREWEKMRKAGIDPQEKRRQAEKEAEAEAATAQNRTFSALAEAFLARPESKTLRQRENTERSIRYDLLDPKLNPWMYRNVSEVDDDDVAVVINAIRDRPAPSQAIHVLSHLKQIFSYGMRPGNRKLYRMKGHPIAHLGPKDFGLEKRERQVLFEGDEIAAFWRATEAMGYPYGPFYKLLLATGQRRGDIANSRWPEFDLAGRVLTIPDMRFKSQVPQMVPLSDLALEILAGIPRFEGEGSGHFLFSTTKGMKPINGFSKAKRILDRCMLAELQALAEARGGDPKAVKLKATRNHDLRRVLRTQLGALKVPDMVAELVIGHGKKGLERIYNQHKYQDEMREALQAWGERLRTLVNAAPKAP